MRLVSILPRYPVYIIKPRKAKVGFCKLIRAPTKDKIM